MAKKPVSVKKQKLVTDVAVHVFLTIVAIVWLIPFVWIIAHSFRGESTGMFCSTFLPQQYTLDNYIGLFTDIKTMNFPQMFKNTFIIACFTCVISTFFVLTPYIITQFTGNINNFNIIYLLTGGGPTYVGDSAGQTDLLVTWLYKLSIDKQQYNMGAVIGIFTFIVLAVVALVTYRSSGSYKDEEGFK